MTDIQDAIALYRKGDYESARNIASRYTNGPDSKIAQILLEKISARILRRNLWLTHLTLVVLSFVFSFAIVRYLFVSIGDSPLLTYNHEDAALFLIILIAAYNLGGFIASGITFLAIKDRKYSSKKQRVILAGWTLFGVLLVGSIPTYVGLTYADKQEKRLTSPTESQDNDFEALMSAGLEAMESQDMYNAQRYFEKATKVNGEDFEAYSHLAFCSRYNGEYASAIEYGMKAYELNPSDQDNLSVLARSYYDRKEYDFALRYFCECIAVEPKSSVSIVNWSYIYTIDMSMLSNSHQGFLRGSSIEVATSSKELIIATLNLYYQKHNVGDIAAIMRYYYPYDVGTDQIRREKENFLITYIKRDLRISPKIVPHIQRINDHLYFAYYDIECDLANRSIQGWSEVPCYLYFCIHDGNLHILRELTHAYDEDQFGD